MFPMVPNSPEVAISSGYRRGNMLIMENRDAERAERAEAAMDHAGKEDYHA